MHPSKLLGLGLMVYIALNAFYYDVPEVYCYFRPISSAFLGLCAGWLWRD
jgi:hypothetical protein